MFGSAANLPCDPQSPTLRPSTFKHGNSCKFPSSSDHLQPFTPSLRWFTRGHGLAWTEISDSDSLPELPTEQSFASTRVQPSYALILHRQSLNLRCGKGRGCFTRNRRRPSGSEE
eukprot:3454492-Rhodomonas_salina.1